MRIETWARRFSGGVSIGQGKRRQQTSDLFRGPGLVFSGRARLITGGSCYSQPAATAGKENALQGMRLRSAKSVPRRSQHALSRYEKLDQAYGLDLSVTASLLECGFTEFVFGDLN